MRDLCTQTMFGTASVPFIMCWNCVSMIWGMYDIYTVKRNCNVSHTVLFESHWLNKVTECCSFSIRAADFADDATHLYANEKWVIQCGCHQWMCLMDGYLQYDSIMHLLWKVCWLYSYHHCFLFFIYKWYLFYIWFQYFTIQHISYMYGICIYNLHFLPYCSVE